MKKSSVKGLFVVALFSICAVTNASLVSAIEASQTTESTNDSTETENRKSIVESIIESSSTTDSQTNDSTKDSTIVENSTVDSQTESKIVLNGYTQQQYDEEKRSALNSGFTEEQFERIMNIPEIPSVNNSIQTRAVLTGDQSKVVNKAKEQIGKPYAWGAYGPGSFDCGGLVKYVYKQAVNMELPMGTVNQENYGKEVSLSSLLPGDLLFYGSRGSTYHVGIYIGNNQMIHAPQPGQNVTTVDIKYFYPSFARRLLPESVPQGPWIADGRYVTITKKGYSLWSSFSWNKKDTTDNLFNKTYQAQGRYEHSNGSTYYSLYDSNGTWKGYLNSEAASVASGRQGVWLNNGQSVSIIKKGYTIWGNIDNFSSKKGNTDAHYQKNYFAQGKYNHFNGSTYLSLYDSQMKWIGYLNSEAAAVKQSTYTEVSKTVMVNRENKSIDTLPWGQSGYSKLASSPQYLGKVVSITQDSGSYAYSPELKGWIDKKGIIEVIKTNCTGKIENSGYQINPVPWYSGVAINGYTKDHIGKQVVVTAKNGSYYYVSSLGWIDKKAFNAELQKAVDATANSNSVTTKKLVVTEINRSATVLGNGKTVDTLPWGTKGYVRVSSSNDYKGKTITLTQDSGSYVFSPELKGWVDKKGLTIK